MARNLTEAIAAAGGPVGLLRGRTAPSPVAPPAPPGGAAEHQAAEHRAAEHRAWRTAAVLYDQSQRMDNLVLTGSDAIRLISDTAVNSTAVFPVDKAKHYVPTTASGHVVGDGILFREGDEEYVYVGRAPAANWLMYHGETGRYPNLGVALDRRPASRGDGTPRASYRFQIQGPAAWSVVEKLNGGPLEQQRFFTTSTMRIAGTTARTLRHGMAGDRGLELWGPYADRGRVRDAIIEAGAEFGLVPAGSRVSPSSTLESGWIPSPLPAIYTGTGERGYRDWLPGDGYEATLALVGSFASPDVEDYYLTPWELGYGSLVRFDHDFIGRDALEKTDPEAQRTKVTLAWDAADAAEPVASLLERDDGAFDDGAFDDGADDRSATYDSVVDADGAVVGYAMFTAYSLNERRVLSLATIAPDVPDGAELRVLWGGAAAAPQRQLSVRAVVSPVPYSAVDRQPRQEGWRTGYRGTPRPVR